MSKIISEETKTNLINSYLESPVSLQEISNKFNMCSVSASRILKEYNIPIYTKQQLSSIGLKEDYFSIIDTEDKAYFLGLFLADGCLYISEKSPRVILGLQEQDSYMIENFKIALNSPNKLVIDKRDNFTTCCVSSPRLASDLTNLGACNNKINRIFPNIHPDLVRHMIRGIFDGDGCITYGVSHMERKVHNSYSAKINIVAYEGVMSSLKYIIEQELGLSTYMTNESKNTNLLGINISRKYDVLKFYHYIYDNATIYLQRKKIKFEEFFRLMNM